jgi:hypothetical protein
MASMHLVSFVVVLQQGVCVHANASERVDSSSLANVENIEHYCESVFQCESSEGFLVLAHPSTVDTTMKKDNNRMLRSDACRHYNSRDVGDGGGMRPFAWGMQTTSIF